MKKNTSDLLYKKALAIAEEKRKTYSDVEIALIPTVICKEYGKVASVSVVNAEMIISEENKI